VVLNAGRRAARRPLRLPAALAAAPPPVELWAEGAPEARLRRSREGAAIEVELASRSARVLGWRPGPETIAIGR
jgi:hypothetical protein